MIGHSALRTGVRLSVMICILAACSASGQSFSGADQDVGPDESKAGFSGLCEAEESTSGTVVFSDMKVADGYLSATLANVGDEDIHLKQLRPSKGEIDQGVAFVQYLNSDNEVFGGADTTFNLLAISSLVVAPSERVEVRGLLSETGPCSGQDNSHPVAARLIMLSEDLEEYWVSPMVAAFPPLGE